MTEPTMTYEEFGKIAASARTALIALGKSVDESGLEKSLTELVKVRASQLNGCAFCLKLHLDWARQNGVSADKLELVAAWREAGLFSAREMAALAYTEALTAMGTDVASGAAAEALHPHFSAAEAVFLTIAVGTINQWNRIAVALRFPPPLSARPAQSVA
jgi:AhpD family alkylhydroperoxidase